MLESLPLAVGGHNRKFALAGELTVKGLLHFESCRMVNSAPAEANDVAIV